MEQTEYIEFILSSMKNNVQLPKHEVINPVFRKLKSFHTSMLWEKSIEFSNSYYENLFSPYINVKDMTKIGNILVKNNSTSKIFFEHMFNKYPDFFITQNQEKIIDFPIDYFPVLFPRTVFNSNKITLFLYYLFQEHENNGDKINFVIDNQKKKYLPYHPDMYYLMLFFCYMKENSEDVRRRYNVDTQTFYYEPFKITDEFLSISKIIYDNFDNIFEVIKPQLVKNTYKGQSFSNTIINEKDFGFFIDFVASYHQKNKIEQKFIHSTKKEKVRKI